MSEAEIESSMVYPDSYFVENAEKRAREWRAIHLKYLDNEHDAIITQAKAIAKALNQDVYIIHISTLAKDRDSELGFYEISNRQLNYAIRLDKNLFLKQEAVAPDGEVCGCEEYC